MPAKKSNNGDVGGGKIVTMPPPQSKEVKRFLKDDDKFLEKLEKFADMPDSKFGEFGQKIVDKMLAHGKAAIKHIEEGHKLFKNNLPYFFEMKQRLLNPKYRPDLNPTDSGRTPEDNLKNFGAKDWADYREKFVDFYSLRQADRLLADFKKETDRLLTPGGTTTFDPITGLPIITGTPADTNQIIITGEPVPQPNPTMSLEELAEKLNADIDGTKSKRRGEGVSKADKVASNAAYYRDLYNEFLGLILNAPPDMTKEDLLATLQAAAQKEYEDLTPEEAKAIRVPMIVKPREVEHLGVQLAKKIQELNIDGALDDKDAIKSALFDLTTMALQLLQAAGLRDEPETEAAAGEAL